MKILFHHRIASVDGQAVHIEELTSALRMLGHDVIIIGPATMESQDFGQESGRIAAMKRHLPRSLYELLELCYSIVAYNRLRAAYREHRPDVLYERYSLFLPAGVWLKRKYGLPMLLEVNAPIFHERSETGGIALKRLARWSEEMAWRGADYVLPVTRALAEIIRKAGVPDERIAVIPNAVNPERFTQDLDDAQAKQRLGLGDRTVLGFTGFVRDWHGLDRVIDLIEESNPNSNLHLLVVGDGPGRPALERRAQERGVAERVTFTGSIQRDLVPNYIAAFDVALQPGVTPYASPLKLFEYMVLGRAIVAPNTPNIREVLIDGKTAVLFNPDAPASFRAAVEKVCGDASLRDQIGAAARDAIIERGLTWDHNARRVDGFINRLQELRPSDTAAGAEGSSGRRGVGLKPPTSTT